MKQLSKCGATADLAVDGRSVRRSGRSLSANHVTPPVDSLATKQYEWDKLIIVTDLARLHQTSPAKHSQTRLLALAAIGALQSRGLRVDDEAVRVAVGLLASRSQTRRVSSASTRHRGRPGRDSPADTAHADRSTRHYSLYDLVRSDGSSRMV